MQRTKRKGESTSEEPVNEAYSSEENNLEATHSILPCGESTCNHANSCNVLKEGRRKILAYALIQ